MKSLAKDKEEGQAGEIDLTPMLDVVFILLIFFIVTAVFVKEAGYDVLKPQASTAQFATLDPILVAISPAGEIYMDGDIVEPRNLRFRLEQRLAETPNAPVIVQADQQATNEHVITILDAARESGVSSVQIAAEE
ncbi:MAG: biopolymer transporter ExbD [Gammaproteobacteria bacterium]|nr:biopolymer transporter ExbD [Gammaproteobacteria bacterium]MAY01504.1 biopolymer transporter ExbD [Gammaproteobacteria bacterium]|tara:strand:+ start:570 stop:974 length:405 start_codon:yes stop_codon:yes gene_type:complete